MTPRPADQPRRNAPGKRRKALEAVPGTPLSVSGRAERTALEQLLAGDRAAEERVDRVLKILVRKAREIAGEA